MFLKRELRKFAEDVPQKDATACPRDGAADASQDSAPVDLGPLRFVDLLSTWDVGHGAPLYLLVSDGEQQAVAVAARSVYEPFKRAIDPAYDVHRMLLVRHMGFVPWRRELLPQELAEFIAAVNGCEAVLKVSVLQLRGGAWLAKTAGPRPPRPDELGPLPARPPASPFQLPSTFEAERPPQFAPIQYSDDESADAPLPPPHRTDEPEGADTPAGGNGAMEGVTLGLPSEGVPLEGVRSEGVHEVDVPMAGDGPLEDDELSGEDEPSKVGPLEGAHLGGAPSENVPSDSGNDERYEQRRARHRYDSAANLEQLISYGTRQGVASESQQAVLERPEILSQGPTQTSLAWPLPADGSHDGVSVMQQTTPSANEVSNTEEMSTTAENEYWTAAEEQALIFGIIYAHGPDWSKILDLYGQDGTVGNDLGAKTVRQIRGKASALKHELIRSGKTLPPGFDAVPLYADDSGSEPERKRLRLGAEPLSLSLILSESQDEPASPAPYPGLAEDAQADSRLASESRIDECLSQSPIPSPPMPSPPGVFSESELLQRLASSSQGAASSQVLASMYSLSRVASSSQSQNGSYEANALGVVVDVADVMDEAQALDATDVVAETQAADATGAVSETDAAAATGVAESNSTEPSYTDGSTSTTHEPNESKSCILM